MFNGKMKKRVKLSFPFFSGGGVRKYGGAGRIKPIRVVVKLFVLGFGLHWSILFFFLFLSILNLAQI